MLRISLSARSQFWSVSPPAASGSGAAMLPHVVRGLSLPETIFERIDGVGRLESDRRQCPRTARSDVYRARPSQAKRGFAPHYNSSRISQGFAEGGQH